VRRIAARPAIVFEAMTTARRLRVVRAGRPAGVARGDGRARRRRLPRSLSDARRPGARSARRVPELVAPLRIVMSWMWTFGGVPEEYGRTSRVEVDLRPIKIGTELTFTHACLWDDASRRSTRTGGAARWTSSLDTSDPFPVTLENAHEVWTRMARDDRSAPSGLREHARDRSQGRLGKDASARHMIADYYAAYEKKDWA